MKPGEKLFFIIVFTLWAIAIALSIYLEDHADQVCLKGLGTPIPCEILYSSRNR